MHKSYQKWLNDGKPKIICQCGCNNEIIIKRHHIYIGISKYNRGHQNRNGNSWRIGKHQTEESNQKNREKHLRKSSKSKGIKRPHMMGGKNAQYGKPAPYGSGRGKGCYYESLLQGKIWLRSSYELAYAQYLDEHKILWMYEMETFDLGNTTYTPDFFLPKDEKFIEIKGYMTDKAQEKINKFKEQYPWDLEILYKEDLTKLGIEL